MAGKFPPAFEDKTQSEGRIVLYVCVASSGSQISTEYKAKGSKTTDEDLIAAAKRKAIHINLQVHQLISKAELLLLISN